MTATPLQMQSYYNQKNAFNSTPSNHIHGSGSSSQSSPYLPGYLFGSSPAQGGSGSLPNTGGYPPQQRLSSQTTLRNTNSFGGSPAELHKQQQKARHSTVKDGAPPIESLFSPSSGTEDLMETDVSHKMFQSPVVNSISTPAQNHQSFNDSVFSPRQDNIPQSPAQIDPFYTQGDTISSDDVVDESAVTVFGFPPAASSYILQEFAQYGTIDTYEIHNTGNWLHIKYQTRIQAKKALSKNGKRFAQSIMIGVLPCIKKELGSDADLTSTGSVSVLPDTPNRMINNKKPNTIRPLSTTPARNASGLGTPTDAFANNNTPQKKDTVMAKALDYVFGW